MAVNMAIVAANQQPYCHGLFSAKNRGTNIKWLQYDAAANATIKLVVTISASANVGWNWLVQVSQKAHATSHPRRETTIDHF